MALANFFDRAATAAAQVLHGYDPENFRARLEAQSVGLAFDSASVNTPEGTATLRLTLNLLARLYPNLALVGLDRKSKSVAADLEVRAAAINPQITVTRSLRKADPCVVIGRTRPTASKRLIYAGSDGWTARVSDSTAVGSADSENPFGAGAAACLAAANVFRHVFADHLPQGGPDSDVRLSLFDYAQGGAGTGGPELPAVDLGRTQLVGAGAIGNAFLWTIALTPRVSGTLEVIDHQAVDLSNLQRYVLADQAHVGEPKVRVAAALLEGTGITCQPLEMTWARFLSEGGFHVDRVAVALDTVDGRIAVQAALPRRVINAWTQLGDLGVSRHGFLGQSACLACLYLPDGKRPDHDQVVAEALGLPEAKREIRAMLYYNQPVSADFLRRVAAALGTPPERLLAYENQPIRDFYAAAICGGAVFGSNVAKRADQALVPMAFQSALAGIMLAAETLIDAGELRRTPAPTKTALNLLKPVTQYLSFPYRKDSQGRCFCQDPDYVRAYQEKWPAEAVPDYQTAPADLPTQTDSPLPTPKRKRTSRGGTSGKRSGVRTRPRS